MSTLSERLKLARHDADLTQNQVALRTGINRATLANWEVGRTEPDADTVVKLAELYQVSLDFLFGRSDQKTQIEHDNEINKHRISQVLQGEEAELLDFWQVLKEREDLFLLFKQVRELDSADIKRVIRIIKAIEDEEEAGNRHD